LIERAPPRSLSVRAYELAVPRKRDDRTRQRLDIFSRNDHSSFPVRDDLRQAPDVADDRGATALGRLEGNHAEALSA
jgi:hypothetical protein